MQEVEHRINDGTSHGSNANNDDSSSTSLTRQILSLKETPISSEDSLVISTLALQNIDYDILKITAGLADQTAVRVGQHRFVDLFKAFEDFAYSNELTPTLYSNYFLCMNIIANLCEIDEDTWLKRLAKLLLKLHDDNEDEIKLADTITLGNEINKFDPSTKERFLLVWHESLNILKEKQTRLNRVALERYRLNTCYNVLNLWHGRYYSLIEREVKVVQNKNLHIQVMSVDYLREVQKSIAQMARTSDQQLFTDVFKNWRKKAVMRKKQKAMAVEFDKNNTVRLKFSYWFYAAHEQSVKTTYNIKIMKRCLDCWINKTQHVETLFSTIVSKNRQKSLENAISIWKKRYYDLNDLNNKTAAFDLNIVSNIFGIWRRKQHHKLLFDNFTYLLCLKHLELLFDSWRHKTRLSVTANRLQDINCSNHYFRVWRLNCKANKLVGLRFENQVWSIYKVWYLEQRSLRVQRLHNTRLAAGIFEYWKFKSKEKIIQANKIVLLIQLRIDTELIKQSFSTWKMRVTKVKNMTLDAEDILYDNLIFKALSMTFNKYDMMIANTAKAADISKRNTLKCYFQLWKHANIQQKKEKLLVRLDQYTIEKTRLLQQTYFFNWNDTFFKKQDLFFQALAFYDERSRALQQQHWSQWFIKTIEITSNMSLVTENDNRNLMLHSFQLWRDSKVSVDILEAILANTMPNIARPVLIQTLRTWKMCMFKLKIKQKMALDFENRLNSFKRKMYWCHWRRKIQRNVSCRLSQLSLTSSRSSIAFDCSVADLDVDHDSSLQSLAFETPTYNRSRRKHLLSSERKPYLSSG